VERVNSSHLSARRLAKALKAYISSDSSELHGAFSWPDGKQERPSFTVSPGRRLP